MKSIYVFLSVAMFLICGSCANEELVPQEPPQSKVETADVISCIGGTLHFPTAELCLKTMESLTPNDALESFEKEYKFHSIRTFTENMLDELAECETPEEYQAILETCSDYLVEDEDRLMPKITSVGYASIADINGVFYVGDIKHTVRGDKVIIESINPKTRAAEVEEIDYICNIDSDAATRGETKQKYTDERYQKGKFKVFARTNVLRMAVAQVINGQNAIVSSFGCQVHVSGQKKKTIIGWNTYKDHFHVEALHFDLNIGGVNFKHGLGYPETTVTSSNGRVSNFYVTVPIGTGSFIKPAAEPMPVKFDCITHRARSGSLGNCGVLTKYVKWNCEVRYPTSNCKPTIL